ncbi:MAG: SMI1/KNR4 family protein [Kofleriaceae bacterium]|nr:SMI1/KNR4 family protein [Myxococcales bacterium]MCB9561403.1 SMI1/KNR4 family protein [Kofleriaceae bacterium]
MTDDDDDAYAATLREAIAHLASHDPTCARFGARHHRYLTGPRLDDARLAAIEAEVGIRLPDDYRAHLRTIGDGGAGPYHGLMPLDHPLQLAAARGAFALRDTTATVDAPRGPALYQGVVGLAHLGCGYVAFLVVAGPARGQVWLDGRGADDGVRPIVTGDGAFRAFFHEWIDALAHARWPRGWVTPGRCALPSALTAYLRAVEQRLGLADGALAGDALREALDDIPDGGIAVADGGDTPFFASGDQVDLCVVCEQTLENLVPQGMRRAQVQPGVAPIPMRDRAPWAAASVP